ncbi:MAG: thioredoxin [Lachnospiraceae bacterium]|nr:thioredoxin [Lachnospiraceae bacterium]
MACAFIAYGVLRGEAAVVLNKAIYICFECIGLG